MTKVIKKKYYRPGTLEIPGTKITLKTQPYTNGVIFDTNDPVSSFRKYMSLLNLVLEGYDKLSDLGGIEDYLGVDGLISKDKIARLKLLVNYLVESPIEIILKDQIITNDILAELEASDGSQR